MLRALAVMMLGIGAWFVTTRRAEGAQYVTGEADGLPPENSQAEFPPLEQFGPPPEMIPPPGPVAPLGIVGLVTAINDAEFGGWFAVADVLAVIEIESSFNPRAYRAEPQINDASYGLMQVLATTAADRGYRGPVEGLFDPETNIRLGMRQLKWSWDYLNRKRGVPPSVAEWIGSYNAGVGNALKGFTPWAYVQKWKVARDRWGG